MVTTRKQLEAWRTRVALSRIHSAALVAKFVSRTEAPTFLFARNGEECAELTLRFVLDRHEFFDEDRLYFYAPSFGFGYRCAPSAGDMTMTRGRQ